MAYMAYTQDTWKVLHESVWFAVAVGIISEEKENSIA